MSILNPPTSIMTGIASGALVVAVYQHALGAGVTDIRAAQPHDTDIESARKTAAWTSAAVLGFIYLFTRDRNSFLIGGAMLGGIDLTVKHANAVHPDTGKIDAHTGTSVSPEITDAYPMPDYGASADAE
jgi:hypothetical protein